MKGPPRTRDGISRWAAVVAFTIVCLATMDAQPFRSGIEAVRVDASSWTASVRLAG